MHHHRKTRSTHLLNKKRNKAEEAIQRRLKYKDSSKPFRVVIVEVNVRLAGDHLYGKLLFT